MMAPVRAAFPSIVAVACLGVALCAGQTPARDAAASGPRGTGVIAGSVAIAARPVRPATETIVTLTGGAFPSGQVAVTDEHGGFVFQGLAPGHYTLSAARASYVPVFFGSKRPGRGPGTPIAIEDGQRVENLALRLTPGAVITGVTFDHLGRRQPSATVLVVDAASIRPDGTARAVLTTRTDAAGQYRAAGLPAGTYLVVARPLLSFSGARVPTPEEFDELLREPTAAKPLVAAPRAALNVTPTFFPSAVDPTQATPITIAAGETREGVDIAMQLVPSAHITGRVVGPDGGAPKGLQLSMISPSIRMGFDDRAQSGNLRAVGVVPAKADGSFNQSALPPGHYTYFARALDPSSAATTKTAVPTLWASVDLDVNGQDVPDLVIRLQPGINIAGRLVADADRTPPDWASARVTLEPMDRGPHLVVAPAPVTADGTFAVHGVTPGTYDIHVDSFAPWTGVRVETGGADVIDSGLAAAAGEDVSDLVIAMSDRAPSIEGRLLDSNGRPAPDYEIVVFPADRAARQIARRIRSVRPASDGRYTVSGLAAGDYLVAAVTEVMPADLDDPGFFDLIAPSAIRVSLVPGDAHALDLRIGSRR